MYSPSNPAQHNTLATPTRGNKTFATQSVSPAKGTTHPWLGPSPVPQGTRGHPTAIWRFRIAIAWPQCLPNCGMHPSQVSQTPRVWARGGHATPQPQQQQYLGTLATMASPPRGWQYWYTTLWGHTLPCAPLARSTVTSSVSLPGQGPGARAPGVPISHLCCCPQYRLVSLPPHAPMGGGT